MQRHMNSKHSISDFTPYMPMSQEKCQRFQLIHPFTCMVAGMTGSGKTVWVQYLLQQAQNVIDQPPDRIIWCYSQWQPAYTQLLMMKPTIEFVQGIPSSLENDIYLDVNIRNLIVIDDQMIEAGSDNRIVNLFTKGSHHRNLSVIYIVQNVFHQGKGSRSISLNSHYLVLFKNPRDKLQILTLAKQMYPRQTALFLKEYEEAVRRPYGYLFVDLKPTTPESCRLRTNVLPGEEKFDRGVKENNISQELLQYLKQQTLMAPPVIPEMQRIRNDMDNILHRTNIADDERARQYMQLQNRFLAYKHQLNSLIPEATMLPQLQHQQQISTDAVVNNLPTVPTPVQQPPAMIPAIPMQAPSLEPTAKVVAPNALSTTTTYTPAPSSLLPSILTPPPSVKSMSPIPSPPKRKRKRIHFVNYLDDDESTQKRRSQRLKTQNPYKYAKQKGES